MSVGTILFDIGGVIIDNPHDELVQYCEDYFKKDKNYARALDFSKFKPAFDKYYPQFQTGLDEGIFWYRVLKETYLNSHSGKVTIFIASAGHQVWGEACRVLFKHREFIIDIIKELRNKGFKLGIISNIEVPSLSFLFTSIWGKYYQWFDTWIFSCWEGILKPDFTIYNLALDISGSRAEETIFIDDKVENCKSAEILGIKTIHYTGYDDFKDELYSYLK